MRLNENVQLGTLLVIAWIKASWQIYFCKPSLYLPTILDKVDPSDSKSRFEELNINDIRKIKKTVRGIKRISFMISQRNLCLAQSLIAKIVLRKLSIPSQLHVGIKRTQKGNHAHAWLDVKGKIIIGGPINDYKELVKQAVD